MTDQIPVTQFRQALDMLLEETFEKVHGIYLDKGTTMFETLATISSEEASRPVGDKCATLAAQAKHVAFYLDVLDRLVRDGDNSPADWNEIWQTTRAVTPEEWEAIVQDLRSSYARVRQLIQDVPAWSDEDIIGGAIGMIVHSAYHLGEIRQALCTIKR